MSIAERKTRERAERESRIVAAARVIAEREGWNAVTIAVWRDEIEYSQPMLYSPRCDRRSGCGRGFSGDRGGAAESGLRKGAGESRHGLSGLRATPHPALYEAMFTLPTELHFADAETRPELREAFDALAAVVRHFLQTGKRTSQQPRVSGLPFTGSSNSTVQADESDPKRARNVSGSWFTGVCCFG